MYDKPVGMYDGYPAGASPAPPSSEPAAAAFINARREFVEQRKTIAYPFPWMKGYLFQDVWCVRSLWFGFSSDNMLEFCNLDGSTVPHPIIGSKKHLGMPKFSTVRAFSDHTILMSLDLLRG